MLAWFGWWAFGRTPKDQVLARQMAFIAAVEDRDWGEVRGMLTDDYSDDYGHDREGAVEDARTVLGGFIMLSVKTELVQVQAVPDLAMAKLKIQVEGKGLGISDLVAAQANSMTQPWFFTGTRKVAGLGTGRSCRFTTMNCACRSESLLTSCSASSSAE